MHIILASASPRRRELIHQIRWEGDIEPGHFPEVTDEKEALAFIQKRGLETEFAPFSRAGLVCVVNAFGKAEDAASRRGDTIPVVGADTIVVLEDRVLGKPGNREEAFSMLRSLSGKNHVVKTGMAILYRGKINLSVTATKVRFRHLKEEEIRKYIETGEPMDKAGAYGIQGLGTLLVDSISGSYDNVVGLPLTVLYEKMGEIVG
ncbi:Maf family protein [Dialister succinatiphilus]|uniref:Maf family protein n=1 Tax=Dialister succinatiphilus TaxID=487173 RepID=UPI0023520880|nr:Maf family protein [Dialister succinatiphilus]